MGYNTTVVILNDVLHHIEGDAEFGKKLGRAVRDIWSARDKPVELLGYGGGAKVVETHHSSELVAVLVGGNTGRELGYVGKCDAIRFEGDDIFNILSALAEQHGCILKRKRTPPPPRPEGGTAPR